MKKICYVAPNYLNGYGYGTPLFYPELFLIFPALLLYLGLKLTTSYKIFIVTVNAISILSMYSCAKKITNNEKKALLSSFAYAFASYRVLDFTVRGALGEALSFMFFPFVILGIYEIIYGDYKKYKYLIIGMSGILVSHLLSSVIIFIYLVIFCLMNVRKLFKEKKRLKYLVVSGLTTFLLTCYVTLPMLEQLISYTYKASKESFILFHRALPLHHLFLESPLTQVIDGEKWVWSPGTVGTMFIVMLILYIITLFSKVKYSKFMKQSILISLIFILLTTRLVPWYLFQQSLYVIQFPWRLYIIPVILLPLFLYEVLEQFGVNIKFLTITMVMIGILSVQTITVFKNVPVIDKDKYHDYEIMFGEYLPVSLSEHNIKDREKIIASNENIKYTYNEKNGVLTITFNNNDSNTNMELPFIYYKGYSAYIGKKKLDVFPSMNGLVSTTIDKEYTKGKIKVFYEGTFIQKFTRYISLLTLLLCICFTVKKMKIKQ